VSGSFTVDDSRWPIAVFTTVGSLDDAQIDAYAAEGVRMLERREPYVVVFDLSQIGQVSGYARARYKQWTETNREALQTYCVGAAHVINSPLLRFITMMVMLISPSPMPYSVCSNLTEALAWAERRLAQAKMSGRGAA
jgi:hypothetical protein